MKYQITSDNIELSASMETLAHDKMQKLEKRLKKVYEDLKSFRIVMNSVPDGQFEVKIYGVVHGKEYFVNEVAFSLEHAMISAVDELERVLIKAKVILKEDDWDGAREAKRFDPKDLSEINE